MHREISHTHPTWQASSNLSLYLLTGLLGVLIGLDLWPVVAGWFPGAGLPTWPNEWNGYRIAHLAAILGGARILYTSLEGLFEGRVGADLALAIATVAAILIKEPLVAAEIVFIGMVGECLESFTFERTQRAIRKIVEVCPRRCWLLRDGQEVRVLVSELQVGDLVLVKPGARVPVDGVVREGRSAVDTSALTGEAVPVEMGPDDKILAGSLNQFGALTIQAQQVAEHTVVGRVIELTARALREKSPAERNADRLARYFLPVVLGLAALTFVAYLLHYKATMDLGPALRRSVIPMLSVLVVACPCALILATPAAVIAALGRLAGTGILIKGGAALERLAGVNSFAFDKTGTLTESRLELGDVVPLENVSADELLRAAATAEQRSEHLLGRLILQEAQARPLVLDPILEFQAFPGGGVRAQTSGGTVIVGTRRLLEEQGTLLPADVQGLLDRLDETGQTVLLVARDGQLLGAIGVRDRVRPEAAGVLDELRALGIRDLALLTGDRWAAARNLAAQLDIREVHGELLPAQKAEFIEQWSIPTNPPVSSHPHSHAAPAMARQVAMMGDGINDAPALARAHVGLAVGSTGTEVAAEAGDIVFMGPALQPLPLLVRLSRQTVRIIRQNILVFAFAVNGLGILLTAWLWPALVPEGWEEKGPIAAVIYHQLGSLAVLLNAMRLLWFERTAADSAWGRFRQRLRNVDRWVERHFLPDDFFDRLFHGLGHHWRKVIVAGAGLALCIYALSGFTRIGPDERAILRRFGRPVAVLDPGLHWCWPWPFEDVVRYRPDHVYTVEIGFRSLPGKEAVPGALGWSSPHAENIQPVPEEAVLITGDGDLVEVQATVRYVVRDPAVFLFEVGAPEETIRAVAESVLRESMAGRPFLNLLTVDRQQLQRELLDELARRCRPTSTSHVDCGVDFKGLSLHDLHPPQRVVGSYYKVTQAMQERDRRIQLAEADATRTVASARARARAMVAAAEAEHHELLVRARAEMAAVRVRYQARTHLSWQEEVHILLAALREPDLKAALDYQHRRRQTAIAGQIDLSDFRLVWDKVSGALARRDKVLIDSAKIRGRLLFFDAEMLRALAPVVLPNRPAPPDRRAANEEGP
jgi:Cu+-exporting ATPase